jgi:4-oxalocrotonate tautomerase
MARAVQLPSHGASHRKFGLFGFASTGSRVTCEWKVCLSQRHAARLVAQRIAKMLRFDPQEKHMPTYHIEMMEGRTVEQKRQLAEAITRVSVEVLGGSPESVDILITDVKRENWATGGVLWLDKK